jgi:hypothetical protein
MGVSFPYYGEDFCLVHGREAMRSQMGNPIAFCEACEEDKTVPRGQNGVCACGRETMDGVRCKYGATHQPLLRMPWYQPKREPEKEKFPWEN